MEVLRGMGISMGLIPLHKNSFFFQPLRGREEGFLLSLSVLLSYCQPKGNVMTLRGEYKWKKERKC